MISWACVIFIYGTRNTERRLGLIADFCPICRTIRPFEIIRIGRASHLFLVSLGSGSLVAHSMRCTVCETAMKTDQGQYLKIEPTRGRVNDLEALVRSTYPNVREVWAERLAIEEKIKKDPSEMVPELRAKYILEPFSILSPALEARYEHASRTDKHANMGCIVTVFGCAGLTALVIWLHNNAHYQDKAMAAAAILAVAGTAYTLLQIVLAPGRFIRAALMPKLVLCLRPLRPQREEIVATLERCRAAGMRIGKKLKAKSLMAQIDGPAAD